MLTRLNKDLYSKIAELCIKSYTINRSVRSVKYLLENFEIDDIGYQAIIFPGTGCFVDWIKNVDFRAVAGMKRSALSDAIDARISIRHRLNPDRILIVAGHSKGAATALCYHRIYNADYCIAFCPARCFRGCISLDNSVMFIDPDDVVPKLGALRFNLPKCELVKLPMDHLGLHIEDHFMEHILDFINAL